MRDTPVRAVEWWRRSAPWLVGITAVAYLTRLAILLDKDPVLGLGTLVGAVPLLAWGARRMDRARVPAWAVATPLVALYAFPFARLALWNTHSPLLVAAHAWHAWLDETVSGGYHAHEVLPGPAYAVYLVVVFLPVVALVLALGALPLIAGGLAARGGALAVARWRAPAATVAVVAALAASLVIYPVACDTHESFVDTPNARCECAGAMVPYYPPGMLDGARTDYCIGVERPVAGTG